MKSLTRTITLLVIFCLATTSSAMLQSPEEKIQTFTISGNTGISGVAMIGLPGDPVTDEHGLYCTEVLYGWSGTVTPTKKGFTFTPASKIYHNVIADQTNGNYVPEIITYTISGQVGIPGVIMHGLPRKPVTDDRGYYTSTVNYGWSGTVTPLKKGYNFDPPSLSYTNVMADQENQNYTATRQAQMQAQYGDMYGSTGSTSRQRGHSTPYRTAVGPIAGRRVLVVPDEQLKPEDLAAITEDMQVMSHILDERFKETRRVQGGFTDFGDFFGRDNRQTEATYLQGYSVLFSMEVNFAFSPPPKQQQQQAEQTDEQVDSTWEKARQQVFSPGESRGTGGPDSAEEYNSQMVEELKRDLITTLKHAANIRGVQPDEWVILTVIGGGRQGGAGFGGGGLMMGGMGGMYGGSLYGGTSSGGMGGFGGGYSVSRGYGGGMTGGSMGGGMMGGSGSMSGGMGAMGGMGGFVGAGVSQTTVLTIRAKKSDIDAYAKDEKIFEQFRRKVQIFTY